MNQTQELLRHFQAFLEEAKLSRVSIKNYVSDVRQFLNWSQISSALLVTHQQIQDYQAQIKNTKPPATYQRYLASMRQFVSFLAIEYRINLPPITVVEEVLTSKDLTNQFKAYLTKEKRSHSTIKNYVSDLNHYWSWSANNQSADIPAYLNHLKLSHTKTSVAHRREAALNKFLKFTTDAKLIAPPSVIPSILEGSSRFLHYGRNDKNPTKKPSLYQRYHSLSFTPYLHLAILVLASSALAIFGYNQIFKEAKSGQAFPTALVRPTRQLAFQGRLTDQDGRPPSHRL